MAQAETEAVIDLPTLLWIVAAYLVGAIPFGLLIGLANGVDVRQAGSGNIGATNVGRVVGPGWGKLCLLLDALKGLLPTLAAGWWLVGNVVTASSLLAWLAVGLAAVLGHVFPVYLALRGGKGVATTIGVALAIYPYFTFAIVAALLAFWLSRKFSGYTSVGSLALALVFPLVVFVYTWVNGLAWQTYWPLHATAGLLGLLILLRHRENIVRLWRGEELRVATPQESAATRAP